MWWSISISFIFISFTFRHSNSYYTTRFTCSIFKWCTLCVLRTVTNAGIFLSFNALHLTPNNTAVHNYITKRIYFFFILSLKEAINSNRIHLLCICNSIYFAWTFHTLHTALDKYNIYIFFSMWFLILLILIGLSHMNMMV